VRFLFYLEFLNSKSLNVFGIVELISEAESDGKTFCTPGSGSGQCANRMQEGLITAAKVQKAEDGSFIQVSPSSHFLYAAGECELTAYVDYRLLEPDQIPFRARRRGRAVGCAVSERGQMYVWRVWQELHRAVRPVLCSLLWICGLIRPIATE